MTEIWRTLSTSIWPDAPGWHPGFPLSSNSAASTSTCTALATSVGLVKMSGSVSTVAIIGFTGKLAQLVTGHILRLSPEIQIRGYCRDKSKVSPSLSGHSRITTIEGQSNDLAALRNAVQGCDAIICCYLGSDDLMINGQKLLIDAAVAEKVPRIMVSDYTLDYRKLERGQLPSKDPIIRTRVFGSG